MYQFELPSYFLVIRDGSGLLLDTELLHQLFLLAAPFEDVLLDLCEPNLHLLGDLKGLGELGTLRMMSSWSD
jgi:hypothetical protein